MQIADDELKKLIKSETLIVIEKNKYWGKKTLTH